jgi:hypothetical protein
MRRLQVGLHKLGRLLRLLPQDPFLGPHLPLPRGLFSLFTSPYLHPDFCCPLFDALIFKSKTKAT